MSNRGKHCNHKVSSFTPTWCLKPFTTENSSPRLKPPSQTKNKKKSRSQNQSSNFNAIEPSSPRIGCIGQIRRRNKPPSGVHASSNNSYSSSSGSSLSDNSLNSYSSYSPIIVQVDLLRIKRFVSSKVLVGEMDPPRPVEKKVDARGENSVSLWKRRQCGGGDALKLQLQLQNGTALQLTYQSKIVIVSDISNELTLPLAVNSI